MFSFLERAVPVMGEIALDYLQNSRVAVLGLGGVGGATAEALCRAGVGNIMLIDNDTVSLSNCNRQLVATSSTIDKYKADVCAQRLADINPDGDFIAVKKFYLPDESKFLFEWQPDCVIDAIDTVTAKLHLATECDRLGIPLFSSMGTGNRMDPTKITYGDISQTKGNGCPLARVIRRELKKRGVEKLNVVFSSEPPLSGVCVSSEAGRHAPGSTAFVPPVAGFTLGYWAVSTLINKCENC